MPESATIGEEYPLLVYDPPGNGGGLTARVSHIDFPGEVEILEMTSLPSVLGQPVVYSGSFTPSRLGWYVATFSVDDYLPAGVHRFYVNRE